MEFRLYLQMLRRSWWIVLLTAFAAMVIALTLAYFSTPIYRATAKLVVSPNVEAYTAQDQSKIISSLVALDKRSIVGTYAEVLNSTRIYEDTLAQLGLDASQVEEYTHVAVVLPDANILELSVEGPDPVTATALANGIGRNAVQYISGLYEVYSITVLDAATVPTEPVRPQPARDASLAFVLGLLLGGVLAIIREQLRTPLEALLARTQIDSDSNVFNRRYFEDQVDEFVASAPDKLASLGLVRLENLATYLEVMPQPVIQQLLRQVTDVMRQELRGNDLIGRWDDLTFSILLPETSGKAAERTLRRVQQALAQPMSFSPDGEQAILEPKVGIGERYHNEPASILIERAESALEEAEHQEDGLVLFKTRALVGF
ncbi:MAG: diguanylate cyclase [Anaerolineae bacterium]|nr:MAG: diguanylate cyclase [Anaerolineae bacterium]